MSYFTGKSRSTAESVAGRLTNVVKEGLYDVAHQHDKEINAEIAEFKTTCGEDEKFSGIGVEGILHSVNEEYQQYNKNYRYQSQDMYKKRKELFNLE